MESRGTTELCTCRHNHRSIGVQGKKNSRVTIVCSYDRRTCQIWPFAALALLLCLKDLEITFVLHTFAETTSDSSDQNGKSQRC